MFDKTIIKNNITEVQGAVTIASLPKYQPLMVPKIVLTSLSIDVYNVDPSGINNIDSVNLMKPYFIAKPVQLQNFFKQNNIKLQALKFKVLW